MADFYVENGVGSRMVEAINLFAANHGCNAVIQHAIHPQMQLPQQGDEWWIQDATKRGFVIITRDLGIFRTASERETVERAGARIIGYARANYTGWQMLAGITGHWAFIEARLAVPGPWMVRIYAGPTSPVVMLGE